MLEAGGNGDDVRKVRWHGNRNICALVTIPVGTPRDKRRISPCAGGKDEG